VWARPWPDNDGAETARLYAIACQEVGQPTVHNAAEAFVAAVDAPRFLPKLSVWLADRGWEKPPPQKKRTREPARGNAAYRNGASQTWRA
jgi:hypothetical protein